MDIRTRVLQDSEAGTPSKEVAAKYRVSRAWVDRVKQRKQTKCRHRVLDVGQEYRSTGHRMRRIRIIGYLLTQEF
jgi:orotate phosphoribosyltransferase-like protein